MRSLAFAALLLSSVGLLAGCGGEPKVGDVSGTVTFEGQPIEHGSISFIPADGNSPTAGGVITDGKYTASRVPTGAAKVRVTGAKVTGKKKMYEDANSPEVVTSTELLPPKYSDDKATELRFDVQSGPQTKDFALTK